MRTGEETDTEELLALFTIQPADEAVARRAGKYLNQFAASHRLELGDSMIAATAQVLGAELITRNVKHYPMSDIVVRAHTSADGRNNEMAFAETAWRAFITRADGGCFCLREDDYNGQNRKEADRAYPSVGFRTCPLSSPRRMTTDTNGLNGQPQSERVRLIRTCPLS